MIEMYTKSYCPFCHSAKALLEGKGESFTEYDVTRDWEKAVEMRRRTGGVTVPQILINGVPVGGFDDLRDLEARGALDALLEAPAAIPANALEGARHETL